MLKQWKTCKQCGNGFEGSHISKFCSYACSMKWRILHNDEIFERVCRGCGTPFTTKIASQIYCHTTCRKSERYYNAKPKKSADEARLDRNDRNLGKILLNLDVDEFCHNFIIHHWQDGDAAEKRRLEQLNPDIDFTRL